MFNPGSTYRIQFHKDFTFKSLQAIIPYLHQLGIKTLYASPIFEATPGSTHGYDVVNPLNINPEIGTLDELQAISEKLKELGMGWLQDIVPNHMAFHPNNSWLMDVLENGKQSAYASFFDIEWDSSIYDGRIMVPFLGLPFEEAIAQKQIQIAKKEGKVFFTYFDQQYPIKVSEPNNFTSAYIKKANNDPELIKEIAAGQAYQLCHWQETDLQINYRRFFTVNGLICLNMQHENVFGHYHQLIKQLLDKGIFQGLRVDHIDGLHDPELYLNNLRALTGPETYIMVEKILEKGEDFPLHWPVQGNTGYDFLATVNNLFTLSNNERLFTDTYHQLIKHEENIPESIADKKAFILKTHMAGELENLYQLFKGLELTAPNEVAKVDDTLKEAIAQLLIQCPVYRYYGNVMPLNKEDATYLESLIVEARKANPTLKKALLVIKNALLQRTKHGDDDYNKRALRFYQRCMQFTGPLMAKGVEDTLMYTYNRFIGHNDVGDAPDAFGFDPNEFHRLMSDRQRNWPLSLNGTSTHDTKRGEDVRARLNVLTDLPTEWLKLVKQWQKENKSLKTGDAPDSNDEYFIYQSILGAHPMPQSKEDDFRERMQEYLLKALREGKQNSDWAEPNEQYEEAVKSFIAALLDKQSSFMQTFANFHQRITDHGIVNSLAQVLLKFTCPGIPDIYQGCELWDLSLVDPDNRRPVDYQLRSQFLKAETAPQDEEFWQSLWQSRYNGQVKQALTKRLIALRTADPNLFAEGDYIPLNVTGKYKDNVFAFARQFGETWYVTAVPLHLSAIGAQADAPTLFDWADTAITLPDAAPHNWQNLLTPAKGYTSQALAAKNLFNTLPVALLKLERPANRGAGLLMHISSLPSTFGLGDIGPEAYKFVDFLFNSGQRYWQLLPVNPVDEGAGYSPYSSSSGMAGNILLISPELLIKYGWLSADEIEVIRLPSNNRADFAKATKLRADLFNTAYQRFIQADQATRQDFDEFKSTEGYWLEDFALYQVLKQVNDNMPWYEWPKALKGREASTLKKAIKQHRTSIDKEKWLQYIFTKQWRQLKLYAAKKGIILFGDMPFYISYDSVDVWSHPELFKLNAEGNIAGIAGVPPDYFSAEGQLWGMPVYKWDALKKSNYRWWLQRIKKNLEYFDLIRLDHFRAFASYWEVPGGEQTAVNGAWMPGPGADFFNIVKEQLGRLPFVAEDLGDIDESVHQLRDQFNLPGMRVLQFAFGDDMPQSDHIPHNYVSNSFAYTGTHDNNTLKGWYLEDIDNITRATIDQYIGQKLSEKNLGDVFARLCYASVANVAILPVQDILGLEGSHRMNMPASAEGNWTWRLTGTELNKKLERKLKGQTKRYNR
jgi:malto-oligosyltrehalose synthase/4-alpha-glucanotransferase